MNTLKERSLQFSHASTIFPSSDIQQSIAFYTQKLGFTLNFEWGDPVSYAVLKKEEVGLHLSLSDPGASHQASGNRLYIFVYDVETLYTEFKARGVEILEPLTKHEYGMKDFSIHDPDKNLLIFGQGE